MNWIGIAVMLLSINTWTYAMFDLGTYPTWAALKAKGGALALNMTGNLTAPTNASLTLL